MIRHLAVFAVDAVAGLTNVVLDFLFPEDSYDDTTAVAEVVGMTDVDDATFHAVACRMTEELAELRAAAVGPDLDFALWASEPATTVGGDR